MEISWPHSNSLCSCSASYNSRNYLTNLLIILISSPCTIFFSNWISLTMKNWQFTALVNIFFYYSFSQSIDNVKERLCQWLSGKFSSMSFVNSMTKPIDFKKGGIQYINPLHFWVGDKFIYIFQKMKLG